MDKDVLLWCAGIAVAIIGALLGLLYKVHSDRIDKKADIDSLEDLEKRHAEIAQRMTQMYDENRRSASEMEKRWREDYTQLNINIGNLTGRIDQVLIQVGRRSA